jgi:hypothetical protein
MSAHNWIEWRLLIGAAVVIIIRAFTFKRLYWDAPLNHGPGFFLGVEVPPGFYAGEGVGWLRRYHTALLVELSIEALALLPILRWFLFPWWVLLPLWAGSAPVLTAATAWGFSAYTRATLGANPPVRPSFAIPLEARRLGDYISWPHEALIAVVTASIWALLLTHGHGRLGWLAPVLMTYLVVGLLPYKIEIVRNSAPVPVERPEEHYHWMEAQRRQALHMVDVLRWFFLIFLADYALLHTWHGWRLMGPDAWLRWSLMSIAGAIGIFFMSIALREQRRVAAMGRSLRPVGSWATPFRPAQPLMGVTPWFATWFGGLVLLLVFFRW